MEKLPNSILYITGHYGTGGKEKQMAIQMRELARLGVRVHFVCKSENTLLKDDFFAQLASFHNLDAAHFQLQHIRKIGKIIDETKPDVVYSWATASSHLCVLSRLFVKHKFKLLNGSIRGASRRNADFFLFHTEKFLYKFYKNVLANSETGLKLFGLEKAPGRFILPNATSSFESRSKEYEHNKRHLPESAFLVTMLASLSRTKDHSTLLRAFAQIPPQTYLILAGDGREKDRLQQEAHQLGISERVRFLGREEDVAGLYAASELAVLSSFGEGISNSILEALAAGLPVICSDSGASREAFGDCPAVQFVPPKNPDALAEAIMAEMVDSTDKKERSAQAKDFLQSHFGKEIMVQKLSKILSSLR